MKIHFMTALFAASALLLATQDVSAQNIIAHWTFDDVYDADADTTLSDSSGNGYDATWQNTNSAPNYTEGILGGAVNFNGAEGPIDDNFFRTEEITDFATAVTNGGFAMSAWINPDGGSIAGIATTRNADAGGGATAFYGIDVSTAPADPGPAGLRVDARSNSSPTQTDGGTLSADNSVGTLDGWYHIAYSSNNGDFNNFLTTAQVYINGVLTTDNANGGTLGLALLSGGNWDIGNDNVAPNQRIFDGLIDDIAIFDAPIDQAKVTSLFNDAVNNRVNAGGDPAYAAPGQGTTFESIRQNYASEVNSRSAGDLNYDKVVDSRDWRLWKDNQVLAAGAGSVPEPSSLLLACAALGGSLGLRRRSRS